MEVEKQVINIGKNIYEGEIKTSAEGSIIVSDKKPDILKVLQVTSEAYLTEKSIDDGKITVKGKVRVNVLYVPESENCKICSLYGIFDFCETLKRSEFKENMPLSAICDVDKVSYRVINSRKIGIDAKILIGVSVTSNDKIEVVSQNSLKNAQIKEKDIEFCIQNSSETFEFSVDDVLDIKSSDILKFDISVSQKEYKALAGKLVVKGKINADILYLDENAKLSHSDYEMPFTEVFDIDEIAEDSDLEVNFEIGETNFDKKGDDTLNISANIIVSVKTSNQKKCSMLSDCYFTEFSNEIEQTQIKMEDVLSRIEYSAVLKQILQKDAEMPDIVEVYKVQAKPYILSTKIENNKIFVSGKLLTYVIYFSEDANNPIAVIKEEIPFNYAIDFDGKANEQSKVVLGVECENLSYTISSKNAVEMRCNLYFSGKIINAYTENVISDIKLTPCECKETGITIYFVKSGDNLWDIGKRYRVNVEDILLANGIDENYTLSCGEKLLIPIS